MAIFVLAKQAISAKRLRVHKNISTFPKIDHLVLTPGTFDGVHKGHLTILNRVISEAKESGGESAVLTFHPHPRTILFPDGEKLKLLNTIAERIERLEKTGLDHLIIHPFTTEFSRLTAIEFVRDFLINNLGVKHLVVGYDHHFGRNREGNMVLLKELATLYDLDITEISAHEINEVKVSSTKVRRAVENGDMLTATNFLGYPYSFSGIVVKGKEIGRKLGFPTANIQVPDENKLIPGLGIYAVEVEHKERTYKGMLSIGTNPTIDSENEKIHIEVHIFDFDSTIYGEVIKITMRQKIREEEQYENLDSLARQLVRDKEEVSKIFSLES